MKKNLALFLLFIFAIASTIRAQEGLPEGIIFSTQEQIDNFPRDYPGCSKILGDVRIDESMPGTLTNLDGLSQVTTMKGICWYLTILLCQV